MYLAKIYVTLKPSVNDPQGLTVQRGLEYLGFDMVKGVRIGKYMEIRLDTVTEDVALTQVQAMCEKLLANPVIEQFSFEIEAATRES